MKLGIFYTVFDGIELLPGSIKQIYDYVDHIVIIYQHTSNKGEAMSEEDSNKLNNEFLGGDKISFIHFTPNFSMNVKEIERQKHNRAIQELKAVGCTHFLMSACDHFYDPEQFLKAKIKARNYDVTLTDMYTYYKKPEWRLDPIENYQMPFICKLHPNTEISKLEYNGFKTDPSVRINTRSTLFMFPHHEIILHHYSMVRNDLVKKLRNAALFRPDPELIKKYISEYENYDLNTNPGVTYFGGRKIKQVTNQFDISVGTN